MDVDGDWKEDSQISDNLRTKILSLELCRHRCIAQANSENPMEVAGPVFKMLTTLLQHDGLLSDKITTRYFLCHSTSTPSDKLCIQSERTIAAEVTSCGIHGIPVSSRCLYPSYNTAFCLVGSDDTGINTVVSISPFRLTYPAGYLFPRPFPFLDENNPPPAYAGAPLPVQHNSFLDGVRSGRRNKEYRENPFHNPCARLTTWSGKRIYCGNTPETWTS